MSDSLYGRPHPKSSQPSDSPSSSTLAFTSTLSSLISKDATASRGRARPSKTSKSDIFTRHNRGTQKRAAADLRDDDATSQRHQSSHDIGTVDSATLHRSKRRMEEKVKIYEDMKSGVHLAEESDDEDAPNQAGPQDAYLARLRRKEKEGLVDFDQKWVDAQRERGSGSEEEEEQDDDNASIISYEDELGRTRRGTRAEAARATKTKESDSNERGNFQERWRPSRPDNLIHGATVQTEAFNPSAAAASQMSYLATRRDRSPTPPEETHYDADGEVRARGTGFYAFSKDENVRRQQMDELMNIRDETQREREARLERRAERETAKEERRRKIDGLRTKRRAEVFLAGLET